MSPAKSSRNLERMRAIAAAAAELESRGTCWTDWARERGLPLQAVRNVLKGRGPCLRGESRQVANRMLHDVTCDGPDPAIACGTCGKRSTERLDHRHDWPSASGARIHDLELLADRLDSRLGRIESTLAELRSAALCGGEIAQAPTSEGEA